MINIAVTLVGLAIDRRSSDCSKHVYGCNGLEGLTWALTWLLVEAIFVVPLALALLLFTLSIVRRRSIPAAFGLALAGLNLALALRLAV